MLRRSVLLLCLTLLILSTEAQERDATREALPKEYSLPQQGDTRSFSNEHIRTIYESQDLPDGTKISCVDEQFRCFAAWDEDRPPTYVVLFQLDQTNDRCQIFSHAYNKRVLKWDHDQLVYRVISHHDRADAAYAMTAAVRAHINVDFGEALLFSVPSSDEVDPLAIPQVDDLRIFTKKHMRALFIDQTAMPNLSMRCLDQKAYVVHEWKSHMTPCYILFYQKRIIHSNMGTYARYKRGRLMKWDEDNQHYRVMSSKNKEAQRIIRRLTTDVHYRYGR